MKPYDFARDAYAELGVDTEKAIKKALSIPVSLHCWQADDVRGLETPREGLAGGGIMATGGYPGRARNGDEMRADLSKVLDLLPGKHRLNLHAFYAETGDTVVERDAIEPRHFTGWTDWAKSEKIGLDFNPTYFAHPLANDGYTLSHADKSVRQFWIDHAQACRRIAQDFATKLKSPCVHNHWVPDGAKDAPADRFAPRQRLRDSYDAIFGDDSIDRTKCVDAVEGKLFGLGSEEYVVGSQEFYSNYALSRDLVLCLDLGHFHPTESVADKVSTHLQFHQKLLLHTSRPIRWDSDHVVILDDAVRNLFLEIGRGKAWNKIFVALDFFDASINRLAAYVIGTRATRQAMLCGLLDPTSRLKAAEKAGSGHERLALMEHTRALPWGVVWDELCRRANVPVGADWLQDVATYESKVLSHRT
ncbi:L-rhamnose isomerase [Synoicihabitans lomoniglobus]|uniref:L-rhamnose isomerase n=1 Tax=Synoicihabitans lomoniglobus TaxID=2909285 RepID=A0AAE9ZX18_9BACT|nr:L-rhamnose isomerase [Opitutaceae bacterium LMO-M01]WED65727.1 L-rhamnose isomerase [Opitutaceae bacterium LMO-M01]